MCFVLGHCTVVLCACYHCRASLSCRAHVSSGLFCLPILLHLLCTCVLLLVGLDRCVRGYKQIDFRDNDDILSLIENKSQGVFALLEDAARVGVRGRCRGVCVQRLGLSVGTCVCVWSVGL